jgi:cell wall-associated NlpC family hydrolase
MLKSKDYSNLIGVPYSKLNCWELCQKFYEQVLNLPLSQYFDSAYTEDKNYVNSLIRSSERDFTKVKSPKFGDLITIKIRGVECHVAIFVGEGLMLHTSKKTGSVIDRIARWNTVIVGYYSIGAL